MTQKTPVMILQELMVKNKSTPEFNLTRTSGGTHDPIFEFMVRAGPITATGIGRSKKEAKHDAAKNALKKLSALGLYNENDGSFRATSPLYDRSESPEIIQTNYVGQLKEFCIEKRLPDPNFELLSDIGPPHARQFTINCSVGTIKCPATSSTKKSAKQLASRKMLSCLIDTLESGDVIVPFENLAKYDKEAIQKRDEIMKSTTTNLSRKIADYCRSLLELDESLRSQAWKVLNNVDIKDPIEQMRLALEALEIGYEIENFPCRKENKCGLTIRLFSDPPFELAAFEKNVVEVERLIAINTIDFLKVMLKTN